MIYSKYNFLYESKHGYLLFNAATLAFIQLNKETYDKLRNIEKDSGVIDKLDEETKSKLIKSGILVEDDRYTLYKKRMRFYFNTFDSSNLGLAIAPTTHCNFACPYCYEEMHKPVYMTEEIENDIISFIKKHERVKTLNLTWYGGEPLMGFASIQRLITKIKGISNIKLGHHTMTSNGYLLTKEKSLFFKEHPLSCIQITIDGNKDAHDIRRVLAIDKTPTYDVIVKNIDDFIKYNPNTRVAIRANLDHSNLVTFIQLYKELSDRWKGKNVIVYPAFVKDFSSLRQETNKDNFAVNGCRDVCLTNSEKMIFFETLYKKYGLNVNFTPEYTVGGCGATIVNYYVVGPTGELYKCWNDIGDKDAVVGSVSQPEIKNYNLLSLYLGGPTMMDDKKCLDCKLLTICDGGCAKD